jgi:hypothetical protein
MKKVINYSLGFIFILEEEKTETVVPRFITTALEEYYKPDIGATLGRTKPLLHNSFLADSYGCK